MKLFPAKLSERATLQNPWRQRVTALFSANVDPRPPLQRGLLNIQGSASGDIETFEKQNELFSLEPVIKCLLLHLLTTVGPPLSNHSKCEDLLVNYGALLLTDLLFWREFIACNFQGTIWVVSCFHRKFFVCSYTALKEITPYAKWSLIICVQSTFALRTPRYNGHPDNTDSS